MTPFIFVLLFAIISSTGAAGGIFKIEGVEGFVTLVQFDSDSNIYAVVRDGLNTTTQISTIYKLDSNKQLLWKLDLNGYVLSITTTKQNDAYVVVVYPGTVTGTLNVIRSGSSTLELVDSTGYNDPHVFPDSEGNLFYIASNNSAKIIKPNEYTPKTILGAEQFQMYAFAWPLTFEDKNGNIYMGGCVNGNQDCYNGTQENRIFLVTAEEKRKENPKGEYLENIIQDSRNEYATQITQTSNGDILITTFHFNTSVGTVQKLDQDRNVTVLLEEDGLYYGEIAKDRVIFKMSPGLYPGHCKFLILTSDYQWIPVKNLQNVSNFCLKISLESDQNGNVFLGSDWDEMDTSPVEYLKYGESETIGVNFTDRFDEVSSMTLDGFGILWLVDRGNLFYVDRIGLVGERIFDSEGLYLDRLFNNKFRNEIFVSGDDGLYQIVAY